jgi:DNA helicase HerA-like ATPase
MTRSVNRGDELAAASLHLGGVPLDLAAYATTGLRAIAVAPSGQGKTNAGLLIAEQLSAQGWVSVLIDPEGEIASLYGPAVTSVAELSERLAARDRPIVVVPAQDHQAFVEYGKAILAAADQHRKPLFVMLDETQLYSSAKKRKNALGESADLVNDFAERGRKRSISLFLTTHRFSGTVHRSLFANANLTLVGAQQDPTAWSALAPLCRSARLDYADLTALSPGEFFCFSRRGVEKIRMPMAEALKRVAPKAPPVKPSLPTTFSAWDKALRAIPTPRLRDLTPEVTALLGHVAGLTSQQMLTGARALADELEVRA